MVQGDISNSTTGTMLVDAAIERFGLWMSSLTTRAFLMQSHF
jgi:hypothetical protein